MSLRRASGRALATALATALSWLAAPAVARAQDLVCDPGDLEVLAVRFQGNHAFRGADLANAIATTASSWRRRYHLGGARRCLDTLEFKRDIFRLRSYYRQRGYYDTRVDTLVRPVEPGRVEITFRIDEGPPVILDSLAVLGLDSVQNGQRLKRLLMPMRGRPFDKVRLQSLIDTVVERLHNNGYARAEPPLAPFDVDYATKRASMTLTFLPGRRTRVGDIVFDLRPAEANERVRIDSPTVRKLLSFRERDVYRERLLTQSQRDLYQLDAYSHVDIRPAPDSLQPTKARGGDTLLTVIATLVERDLKSLRVGAGWATLDCIRTQARYTDRNFLGGARRLELNGQLSKIGVGHPLDAPGGVQHLICPTVENDTFSARVNYYAGVTLRQPTLFGPRNVPVLTLYSERRSEFRVYERLTSFGTLFSLTREIRPRVPLTLAYDFSFRQTHAEPAVFCSVFNVCSLSDIGRLTQQSRLAVLSGALSRDRTDVPVNPSRGDVLRMEMRHASTFVGSDHGVGFNKWVGEAASYSRLGRSTVLAARLQIGGVLALGSFNGTTAKDFVPPEERLYAGGPNSVRGYNQNQLGPVVYIVDTTRLKISVNGTDTVRQAFPDSGVHVIRASATGGNALVVANLELRWRSPFVPELLQWVTFLDAGQVYIRSPSGVRTIDVTKFRYTPGIGLRVQSPVGPIRFDVAYNKYPLQQGPAFVLDPPPPENEKNPPPRLLRCVSPSNTLPNGVGGDCPATFQLPANRSFLSRLTFHFSIGQAF